MFEVLVAATATTGLLALALHNREQPFVVDPRLIVDLTRKRSVVAWINGQGESVTDLVGMALDRASSTAVVASGTEAVVNSPRLSGTRCGVNDTRTGAPASALSSCSISAV